MGLTPGGPDTAFVKQYSDNITLLAQQMEPRIRPAAMVDMNFKGEEKYYDQYGTDDMIELTSRYQDTPIQSPNHQRRRVTPRFFVSNTLEDPQDALAMLVDPKSAYLQAKAASAARKQDDVAIAALGGTAYYGKVGGSSITLAAYVGYNGSAGTQIIASSSTGMTKSKIIKAKVILDSGEVEKADRFMLHSASQLGDLLSQTEVTSADYNIVKALVEGDVNTWIGFRFIHTERLAVNGSSERLCYAFQRKGLQMAYQKDVEARVDQRPDKNYAWQVYLRIALGATRLEEARVVQLACTETF